MMLTALPSRRSQSAAFTRKIKLGVIGNAGAAVDCGIVQEARRLRDVRRGGLFPGCDRALRKRAGRGQVARFSTLSGYKKLIESGVEAVPLRRRRSSCRRCRVAVEAGLHVYMAKPVRGHMGCLQIEDAPSWPRRNNAASWSITRCPPIPEHRGPQAHPCAGLRTIAQVATSASAAGSMIRQDRPSRAG